MADIINIGKRLDALEKTTVEEKPRDVLITAHVQQWMMDADGTPVLMHPQPEPIGFTEPTWRTLSDGSRWGTRDAIYPPTNMDSDDGGDNGRRQNQ